MPRRKYKKNEPVKPDWKFKSTMVSNFIRKIMLDGKKSTAEAVVYNSFDEISKRLNKEPLEIFEKALENVMPLVEVKSRRVGGATYQVPIEVTAGRKLALAFRWIIGFARKRKGRPMAQKLADELVDAFNNTGSAVKKREDTHRMAEANKAFAHYRW